VARILMIEDEESFGEALEYQLTREGYQVDRVTDGKVGLERFQRSGADLVLLDLMLPGMPGEEVCRAIRRDSDVPIIMVTARDDDVDKIIGLEIGADDYLTKPFNVRELVARMKAVLRRTTFEAPTDAIEVGGIRLDRERFEVTIDGRLIHMPRKEFEVLEMLMWNAGRVVTRERLIDEVWGADYYGDTRTLDVHIKRLRAKTETDPKDPQRLMTVRGIGYKFVG
jgi:two-component system, OmpR family, response regulator RegX3